MSINMGVKIEWHNCMGLWEGEKKNRRHWVEKRTTRKKKSVKKCVCLLNCEYVVLL